MEHLFENLARYGEGDIYPYHMPGHKRNICGALPPEFYKMDITEIEGFDNLHQPEGILLELQKKAAALCGAEESFYLVNGSTGGILSAVSAALPPGGHILMARNCHKSAYHAAYLRNLTISYLYPEMLEKFDIFEAVTPKQVRAALEKEPDIGAVLIVSPTYEGRIADIREIAREVHQKGIPLIVDEAHGAHLGLSSEFHENSCRAGADLVIQSTHKTLPALTQTALLHVCGKRIDRRLLKRFLHIYQSSSPSYLLMASIDNALHYVEENGKTAFTEFKRQYDEMLNKLSCCRCLSFLPFDRERQDTGKLVISVKNTTITGKQLYDILLNKYHLQTEMATESYVLAMFTVGDSREGYRRMTEALLEIDGRIADEMNSQSMQNPLTGRNSGIGYGFKEDGAYDTEHDSGKSGLYDTEYDVADFGLCGTEYNAAAFGAEGVKDAIPLSIAWDREKEYVPLTESEGRYVGEFVNLYPPGVPLLVPGEKITGDLLRRMQDWMKQGLTVQGIEIRCGKPLIYVLC